MCVCVCVCVCVSKDIFSFFLLVSSDSLNKTIEINKQFNQLEKQRGFSLISVMITMVISLVLLLGMTKLFISNQHIFELIKAQAEIQENARIVSHVIRSEIHKAGFFGCRRIDGDVPVEGFGVYDKFYLQKNSLALTQSNPDVLSIMYLDDSRSVKENDVWVSSDCESITIHPYEANNSLLSGRLIQQLFYVKNTGRKNKKGEAVFGFFIKTNNLPAVEIAEGIEEFKVKIKNKIIQVKFTLSSFEAVNNGRRLQKEWVVIAKAF